MHVPYYVPSTLFFKALELSFHASLHDALVLETSFTFFWEPPTKADAAIFSSFLFSRVVEKFQVNLFYSLRLFYYPFLFQICCTCFFMLFDIILLLILFYNFSHWKVKHNELMPTLSILSKTNLGLSLILSKYIFHYIV